MSRNDQTKKGKGLSPALVILAVLAALAVVYGIFALQGNNKQAGPEQKGQAFGQQMATGAMKRLVFHKTPKDVSHLEFTDGQGKVHKLSEWKGKVVLVNFWATWCFPCRREMPEIARLQKAFDKKDFEVIVASEDKKGHDWAKKGLEVLGGDTLTLMMDTGSKDLRALGERGLPTTILVDKKGREFARLIGPAAWSSAEAKAIVNKAIAQK